MPQMIDGHQVVKTLGKGGFGAVYLAKERVVNEDIAIKTLLPELALRPGVKDRFLEELAILKRLDHPGIVQVFDHGTDPSQGLYFTMPYLKGGDLDFSTQREDLSIGKLLNWWIDLIHILSYAHGQGVVHRDLKPQNIVISDGSVVVVDWGLGRPDGVGTHQTSARGTPGWAPPELEHGRGGIFTDTFGLTGLLSWILTGLTPSEVMIDVSGSLAGAGYLDPVLASVVQKGLSDFRTRFQSMPELATAFRAPISAIKRQLFDQHKANQIEISHLFWSRSWETTFSDLQPDHRVVECFPRAANRQNHFSYKGLSDEQKVIFDTYLRLGIQLAEDEEISESEPRLWRIRVSKTPHLEFEWTLGQGKGSDHLVTRTFEALTLESKKICFEFLMLFEGRAFDPE